MDNQKQFNNFTYNTKCNIWRISYSNKDKEYGIKNYYSDEYNITSFNNSLMYKGICINQLNMFYGELCAMYYVWKNNLKSDIVGFDQYRRQWKTIDFDNINKNKIQTYTYWKENKSIIYEYNNLGNFLYSLSLYIKFYHNKYINKLDSLLFETLAIKNHVNIFICKWNIFCEICKIVFGYLDYILPNNQWMNKYILKKYIDFNVDYHSYIGIDATTAIVTREPRHLPYLFEILFGTIYNTISESFCDYSHPTYYVVYQCNTYEDYCNIMKLYKYNVGNGVLYIIIDDKYNIAETNLRDDKYFKYVNLILLNDGRYSYGNEFVNEFVTDLEKQCIGIKLNNNEYVYSKNAIELSKGNYEIKKI